MKPVVLLDCDGVLSCFVSWYLDMAASVTGRMFQPSLVTQWDVAASLGLSPGERAEVERLIHLPGSVGAMQPLSGAVEGVALLREVAEVHVVTSPWPGHPTWTSERSRWLRRHFGLTEHDVTHTSAKHRVRGDALVDDKWEHVRDWHASAEDGVGILWDQPYNRDGDAAGWAYRLSSWERLAALVRD